jgi:enoyl-CoA hydratase
MFEFVNASVEDHVGVIKFNRPQQHNAVNNAMGEQVQEAIDWALGNDEVRCLLITGEGKSFSAGRDTASLGVRPDNESYFHYIRRVQERRLSLLNSTKPVISAINGYALGGGCEMALAADIRIAAEDAVFSLPEINYGLLPDTGGTQYVTALAGPGVAKYMIMTGARVGAAQAFAWGLVDFLVKTEDLQTFALDMAKDIAGKPPINLAIAKQLIDNIYGAAVRDGVRQEAVAQTSVHETADYQEARAALREKRKPVYRGL